jgi:hypothetical protein
MERKIMVRMKLDDERGNYHSSGIMLQNALDRKGITHKTLAKTSGYSDTHISRLLTLKRYSVDLFVNVLKAMVKLGCITSLDFVSRYLSEVPAKILTTGQRTNIISKLKEELDRENIALPETTPPQQWWLVDASGETVGSVDKDKLELQHKFGQAAFRIYMALEAGKTPQEVHQIASGAFGMFDSGEVAQAIEQVSGFLGT